LQKLKNIEQNQDAYNCYWEVNFEVPFDFMLLLKKIIFSRIVHVIDKVLLPAS